MPDQDTDQGDMEYCGNKLDTDTGYIWIHEIMGVTKETTITEMHMMSLQDFLESREKLQDEKTTT